MNNNTLQHSQIGIIIEENEGKKQNIALLINDIIING